MINPSDLCGLGGVALTIAGTLVLMLGRLPFSRRVLLGVGTLLFVLLLLPFGDLPLAAYPRGMVGDLSISTLLLVLYALARRGGLGAPVDPARRLLALLIPVLGALLLYPLALGAAYYDPYRWGFGEPAFLGSLLVLSLLAIAARLPLVAVAISLAVLAWAAGVYESRNLWDYLLDPLLALYAFAACLRAPFARRAKAY
ncbi:hypothetical protein GH865_03105 [Rhodocyclus tenuis]|uniref:hypothetical protein n=1 Tax=Rhodocyclus gracilis TaxID=2929842 RepID=UPI001298AE03|nr:hypothetical protein [Rhodocyclus gracilis]MRD72240.1 hypothetical protein [Rhodocyclus gracilis]